MTPLEHTFLRLYPTLYLHFEWLIPHARLNSLKHKTILNYLERNYRPLINKYKLLTPTNNTPIPPNAPLWVMWLQGEQTMPPIVKACYNNLKKHAGQHPITLLTLDNLMNYLKTSPLWNNEIDTLIKQKDLTHLSDIVRCIILHEHGGIWVDATLWLNQPIDTITHNLTYITARRTNIHDNNFSATQGKWKSYFIGCNKGNPLPAFIAELMTQCHIKEHKIIDYLLVDYAFMTAYNNFPYVKKLTQAITPLPDTNNGDQYELLNRKLLNQPFSQTTFNQITQHTPFQKMSYKSIHLTTTPNGQPTYYAHLISTL